MEAKSAPPSMVGGGVAVVVVSEACVVVSAIVVVVSAVEVVSGACVVVSAIVVVVVAVDEVAVVSVVVGAAVDDVEVVAGAVVDDVEVVAGAVVDGVAADDAVVGDAPPESAVEALVVVVTMVVTGASDEVDPSSTASDTGVVATVDSFDSELVTELPPQADKKRNDTAVKVNQRVRRRLLAQLMLVQSESVC